MKGCVDCPEGSVRPIKALKRCATHHREELRRRKASAHDKYVQRTYGLLPGEYEKLYKAQGGKCAICRISTGKSKRLSVEHDHKLEGRGSIRSLACGRCNYNLLGIFGDDTDFYRRVITYLEHPPAREVLT